MAYVVASQKHTAVYLVIKVILVSSKSVYSSYCQSIKTCQANVMLYKH